MAGGLYAVEVTDAQLTKEAHLWFNVYVNITSKGRFVLTPHHFSISVLTLLPQQVKANTSWCLVCALLHFASASAE